MKTSPVWIKNLVRFFFFAAITGLVAYKSGWFERDLPVKQAWPQSSSPDLLHKQDRVYHRTNNTGVLLASNSIVMTENKRLFIISSSKSMVISDAVKLGYTPSPTPVFLKNHRVIEPPAFIKRTAPEVEENTENK